MPTITDAIRHGQREIRRQEGAAFAQLLREYEDLWQYVEFSIRRYDAQIQAAIDAGETVNPAWVRRQQWYTQLQRSVDDQFVRFNRTALGTLTTAQTQAVGIAAESARMFAGAVNISPGIVARVNPQAFERWVSAIQPDSPLRGVVDRYGERVKASLLQRMSEGLGGGEGVNSIVRRVVADVGPDAVEGRLQTTVRHETLRAYRGSFMDQMDALPPGVVTGYRWQASLTTRTCALCWALHGTESKTYRMDQHIACRCVQVPLVSPRYAPPRRFGLTGEERFAELPEDKQRVILPSTAHFDLYQSGVPLGEMLTTRRSRQWGDSVALVPAGVLGKRHRHAR